MRHATAPLTVLPMVGYTPIYQRSPAEYSILNLHELIRMCGTPGRFYGEPVTLGVQMHAKTGAKCSHMHCVGSPLRARQ